MHFTSGRTADCDANIAFFLGPAQFAQVAAYKYLGVWLTCRGGCGAHLDALRVKCVGKTWQLLSWCRSHRLRSPLVIHSWLMYVQSSAMFALSVLDIPESGLGVLDALQRRLLRYVLGFT